MDQIKVNSDKTPYDLWKRIPTTVNYFRIFISKCHIKIVNDDLGKFDSGAGEGIFLAYASQHKDYIWYNLRMDKVFESAYENLMKQSLKDKENKKPDHNQWWK